VLTYGSTLIRALVRDRARATGLPEDVEVVMGDLARPETLRAAFIGVERVFLLDASHGVDHTRNVITAAREAGVQRIVSQSSIGAGLNPTPIMGRRFAAREALIRESGMAWTFLRPSYLMSNTLWWLPSIKAEGVVRDPIGPGRFSSIDPDDIAAVAAAALTQEGHTGQIYVLTSSELQTVVQQVEILARVLGRRITYIETTPEEEARKALARGTDQAAVEEFRDLNQMTRANQIEIATDDVERVTGIPPTSFERWCQRNAATFN